MTEYIDISQFERNANHFPAVDLLLTVKSFDLQAIRKRYLTSRGNMSGLAGSVERREVAEGGIVQVRLDKGTVNENKVLSRMKEPRGIDWHDGKLAIAAENEVYVFANGKRYHLEHSWFSYIHTVSFSPDGERLLISSSGLDCIFEFDWKASELLQEWFAWENGFNKALEPETKKEIILTRQRAESAFLEASGIPHRLITDPYGQRLPTAMRAAFINSVVYDTLQPGQWLGTFFHEGRVYAINAITGDALPRMEGLQNPHGGRRWGSNYLATSTAGGEVVVKSPEVEARYRFHGLPGKPPGLEDLEWLQNTCPIGDFLVTIDSNRTSFILFDPAARKYTTIPYDQNWAVQDMIEGRFSEEDIAL